MKTIKRNKVEIQKEVIQQIVEEEQFQDELFEEWLARVYCCAHCDNFNRTGEF